MRRVSIFGATGSIGQNTLDLLRRDPTAYQVVALSGGRNIAQLAKDALEFSPEVVVTAFADLLPELQAAMAGSGVAVEAGAEAIARAAERPADWIMSCIVGVAGLTPSLHAVQQGTTLALANKESLVAAGHLVMPILSTYGARIIPVDSEHNAIHQCLMGQDRNKVQTITLTASGGPFLYRNKADMALVTKADALAHPNWVMGAKVSIDSATLMNKGLELLEASHLFAAPRAQLSAIIHPQSIIHGMVDFCDGSVMAHLATADMKLPLGFALGLEERLATGTKPLRLTDLARLDFLEIDREKFPCFAYAEQVIDEAPEKSVILNSANEIAVEAFLADKIAFHEIVTIVGKSLDHGFSSDAQSLDGVYDLDEQARAFASQLCHQN